MNLQLTITELSNLTGRTRPTIYKYISAYEKGSLDDIPFSFIQLLLLMDKPGTKRKDVVDYCNANFKFVDSDLELNEIITLIKNNKEKINLDNLKKIIEEELSK